MLIVSCKSFNRLNGSSLPLYRPKSIILNASSFSLPSILNPSLLPLWTLTTASRNVPLQTTLKWLVPVHYLHLNQSQKPNQTKVNSKINHSIVSSSSPHMCHPHPKENHNTAAACTTWKHFQNSTFELDPAKWERKTLA